MARATLVKTLKARKKAQPICAKCSKVIEPGEMRYTWTFFRGATYNRHQACGHPRPSELTQGLVGELYAAQENVEDVLAAYYEGNLVGGVKQRDGDVSTVEEFKAWAEDVGAALEEAGGNASDLAEQYREAAENFGGEGENAERADACEEWASTLEDAASTVRSVECDPEEDTDDDAQALEDALDTAKGEVESAAQDAIGELSI